MLPHVNVSDRTTHPRKTLDLGCGSGAWIISAASLWPKTRFVGFDLVPQIANLSVFEETSAADSAVSPTRRFSLTQRRTAKKTHPNGSHSDPTPTHRSLSERVRFVHGNFLISGLPFEDGEFDHVRIAGIAKGVPENKVCHDIGSPRRKELSLILPSQWDYLLAEVHRVLCNGGHLEMIEEDIIFPILPRRIDAPAQRRPPNEELDEDDEEELFYRRPTHHSTSSAGSSSSSSALHIAKKEDDVSHSRVQSTSSRRTSVPPQPLSVSILAHDPSASTYSSNLSTTESSRSLPTNKQSRTAAGKEKPLPPPPSFKSGALNNSGSHPDTPTRASLAQSRQTSPHSGDIPRISGTPGFQPIDSIRPASAQNPQKSGHNVHSMAFAIIGRRPASAKDSRPPKKEWIITAPPSRQPPSSKVPCSQSVEPVTHHEHAVLEVLFNSVFEGRFINTSPTAILPSYLNIYFKNLIASPRVDMPTPPAPERRVKDIFETEDLNMVSRKPALKGPLRLVAAMANRYTAPQTCNRPRTLSRSASIPLGPRSDFSASSESEESDFAYWSARSLVTPTTPPQQLKGITFIKGEEHPGENNKEFPSSSLLTMFDEEDDAREAITSPTSSLARLLPETKIAQEGEAPINLDVALAAIERHDHFYREPLSALRRRSVEVGSLKRTCQRKPTRYAEKYTCQSHTRVKARDSAGSGLCLPSALFKLDECDMALHLRKTYMGAFQWSLPESLESRDSLSISRCHRLSRGHVGGNATSSQDYHRRTWDISPNNVAGSCSVGISRTIDERCGEV